jgi:2-desacetyl-2-hydroxyethyl bacteriochlorophyllide A dehydrogenase
MLGQRATVVSLGRVELLPFEPPAPQAGEVLVQTTTTLISPGTERAFLLALPNTTFTYPLYPGYSNVGQVIALGAGVDGFRVGDRVATPAAHASHVVVKAARCVPVPPSLPDDSAVFFNLIAIAMQGVHKARIELGESVVIIGAGIIGLLAAQLARLAGGVPVISIDTDAGRRTLAERCGADMTFNADDHLLDALRQYLDADGANVVIEVTGAAAPILTAFQIARTRGRVVLLGSARGDVEQVNFYRDVHRKGLTIIGAHEITRPAHESFAGWWTQIAEQRTALNLLTLDRFSVAPLVSHRFSWREFPRAYDLLAAWDSQVLGMMIDWRGAAEGAGQGG